MFSTNPADYQLIAPIGAGVCSKIYKAIRKDTGENVVIKIIELENFPLSIDFLLKQTSFWSMLDSDYIINYYGSFIYRDELWIVSETMSGGSLSDVIRFGHGNGIKNESIIAEISKSVLLGLKCLHKNKGIHRDIRSGNILINSHGEVKISDFSLATSLFVQGNLKKEACSIYGDACYIAPEMLLTGSGYTTKTDIWSFGLCVIEMATGKNPYEHLKTMEAVLEIVSKEPPKLPDYGYSKNLRNFVSRCLTVNSNKRADVNELLNHKFLLIASGKRPIITEILKTLPPIEQRYKIIFGEEEHISCHDKRVKYEFDFNVPKKIKRKKRRARSNTPPPKSSAPPVNEKAVNSMIPKNPNKEYSIEKKGRFTIKKISKKPEYEPNVIVTEMKNEISLLNNEIIQLERDSSVMKEKIQNIITLIKEYQSKIKK